MIPFHVFAEALIPGANEEKELIKRGYFPVTKDGRNKLQKTEIVTAWHVTDFLKIKKLDQIQHTKASISTYPDRNFEVKQVLPHFKPPASFGGVLVKVKGHHLLDSQTDAHTFYAKNGDRWVSPRFLVKPKTPLYKQLSDLSDEARKFGSKLFDDESADFATAEKIYLDKVHNDYWPKLHKIIPEIFDHKKPLTPGKSSQSEIVLGDFEIDTIYFYPRKADKVDSIKGDTGVYLGPGKESEGKTLLWYIAYKDKFDRFPNEGELDQYTRDKKLKMPSEKDFALVDALYKKYDVEFVEK